MIDTGHTWLVAKTGNDGNSGHPSSYPINLANDAFLTIQKAIGEAANGDTVIVWPGDYGENVTMAIKGSPRHVNLIGTNRDTVRIIPAVGIPLCFIPGATIANLSCVTQDASSAAIVMGSGLYSPGGVTFKNIYAYSKMDGMLITNSAVVIVRLYDSVLHCDYNGVNLRENLCIKAERCLFKSTGDASNPSHAVQSPGNGSYKQCAFQIIDSPGGSAELGCVSLKKVSNYPDRAVFDDCTFIIEAPGGRTGAVYGVKVENNATAVLRNCIFNLVAANASGGPKDLVNAGGTIIVSGCRYDLTRTSGTIIQQGTGWQQAIPVSGGV
jgi:hypothetical protein